MDEYKVIRQKIAMLEDEHRSLDLRISGFTTIDMLEIQRLKKQKLALKDQISRLYSMLHPDIIA
ncbi:MAG TPA: hypothetical protein DIV86_01945 [Alphaproteobacteria bacterium]|nr:hypothetical protein [Alphaproteobacteria bacterium]